MLPYTVGTPAAFGFVEWNGRSLTDNAPDVMFSIAANTPIRVAADLGASRIIVLPTGYACSLKEFPKGSLAKHLHSMTLLIAWQLIRDLDWCPDEIDVSVVPPLCPLDVSPFDFSASHYLMERAADSTRKWLDDGGLSRRWHRGQLHAHRH